MSNNIFIKLKSQLKKALSGIKIEIIKEDLGLMRLREGKVSLYSYLALIILIQHKQIKNLKKFYLDDVDNYIKNKPSYANFLKHINKLGLLLKHLVDLKLIQNFYFSSVKNYFLDSTKIETCKTGKRKTKSHQYLPEGKPSKGHSTYGEYFGYKMTCIIDEYGRLCFYDLVSACEHDIYILDLLPDIFKSRNKIIYADKGYLNKQKRLLLFQQHHLKMITPIRNNMKLEEYYNTEDLNLFKSSYQKRQSIERYFKKIKEDLNFNHFYHNKSDFSLKTKIFANLYLTLVDI